VSGSGFLVSHLNFFTFSHFGLIFLFDICFYNTLTHSNHSFLHEDSLPVKFLRASMQEDKGLQRLFDPKSVFVVRLTFVRIRVLRSHGSRFRGSRKTNDLFRCCFRLRRVFFLISSWHPSLFTPEAKIVEGKSHVSDWFLYETSQNRNRRELYFVYTSWYVLFSFFFRVDTFRDCVLSEIWWFFCSYKQRSQRLATTLVSALDFSLIL
jgi:hypothetical protein